MNSTFSIDTNHYTTSSLPTPVGWPELDDAALHGLAGDFASEELGRHALTALDLVEYLPEAFSEHEMTAGE